MFIKSCKEELNCILTNKINMLVLFILPVIFVLMLGFELSGGVIGNIPIAVVNYDNSSFSRQLVDVFDKNETFDVAYYAENEVELEDLIRNGKAGAGLIIPRNFYNDIAALKSPTVLMVYDGSSMSVTSAAKSKATEILLTYKAGAAINHLTARLNLSYREAYNICQAFQLNTRMLYNPAKSFDYFLSPVLIAGYIQAAIALVAAVSVNHEIYREPAGKRLGYTSGKIMFYTLCGSLSFILCIAMQVLIFRLPFKGSILSALILILMISFAASSFSVLISAVIKNRMVALVGGAVIFIPNSAMAGTTWPVISMPSGYQSFAAYMPFAHYANNIRKIYLQGLSTHQIMGDACYMLIFSMTVLILTELVMAVAAEEIDDKELS